MATGALWMQRNATGSPQTCPVHTQTDATGMGKPGTQGPRLYPAKASVQQQQR